ncbi:hypothetical protein HYX07_02645 [Candidatus Woesearchaeota archaeon]|nr:hypothetical protein [Candidatus Woesearchaeota archaeon]
MSFAQLVGKYSDALFIDPETAFRMPEVVASYREFGKDLISLPVFVYRAREMFDAMAFAAELGFNHASISFLARYAMRRAALQHLDGPARRTSLWEMLELVTTNTGVAYKKFEREALDYVTKGGKPNALDDLSTVKTGMAQVRSEAELLKRIAETEAGYGAKSFLRKVAAIHESELGNEDLILEKLARHLWGSLPQRRH